MIKQLWAPWRMEFLKGEKPENCVFCTAIAQDRDRANLILHRDDKAFVILNKYPYNNGHLLILPKRHVDDTSQLTKPEREDLMDLLELSKKLLDKAIKPHGYNVGMNLGRAAGAGFPGHLHIHLVPRWKGDANFMPVITDTRVISQSLKALHQKISYVYKRRV